VCILEEGDEVVLEQRLRTQRERLGELLGKRAKARVLLESSTESEWVARCLEELGHEVVVDDPNLAPMYATRSRQVKTDKRDARTLAEACKLGAYRPAHRTSEARVHMRAQPAVREALVRTRTRYIALVGALVRREGLRIAEGEAESFVKRVAALPLPGWLKAEVAPLLS
jgi:transposase